MLKKSFLVLLTIIVVAMLNVYAQPQQPQPQPDKPSVDLKTMIFDRDVTIEFQKQTIDIQNLEISRLRAENDSLKVEIATLKKPEKKP